MTKDYLVLNVNSTEFEKPCSAEIRNFLSLDPEFRCLETVVAVTLQRTAPLELHCHPMIETLGCWCWTSAVVRSSSERVTHQQDIKEGRGMKKNHMQLW